MLNITRYGLFFFCLFGCILSVAAQQGPTIEADERTYNFGTIAEEKGLTSHTFEIKNTGDAPLVINRITASCGCTQPEWSREPIAPGKTGHVKVTYNPKGRPGPFYKTVSIFSNAKRGSYTLAVKGDVTPKPLIPLHVFPYSIGALKIEAKSVLYNTIRPEETQGKKIAIKNEGKTSLTILPGKYPDYLTVDVHPEKLAPDEVGEITFLLDAKAVKRKGRVSLDIPLTVISIGEKEIVENIHLAANVIDNFGKLSANDKAKAPIAQLNGTLLDLGKLPEKGNSIIPLIGGKVSGSFTITNAGKSPLQIYSVTCDDKRIDISGGKRELKPGATATFKVSVRPKEIKTKLEALVNIICNDPNGPVRLLKVTAYK